MRGLPVVTWACAAWAPPVRARCSCRRCLPRGWAAHLPAPLALMLGGAGCVPQHYCRGACLACACSGLVEGDPGAAHGCPRWHIALFFPQFSVYRLTRGGLAPLGGQVAPRMGSSGAAGTVPDAPPPCRPCAAHPAAAGVCGPGGDPRLVGAGRRVPHGLLRGRRRRVEQQLAQAGPGAARERTRGRTRQPSRAAGGSVSGGGLCNSRPGACLICCQNRRVLIAQQKRTGARGDRVQPLCTRQGRDLPLAASRPSCIPPFLSAQGPPRASGALGR